MRKINGKLFLALLLGTGVLTGAVFVVHHFQYQRIARAMLFQARRFEQADQPAEHAKYLQRYLEFNPRDPDETANLARLWASDTYAPTSKQRRQSVALMDQVLAYKDDPELRRLFIKTALEMRPPSVSLARQHLDALMSRVALEEAIRELKSAEKNKKPLEGPLAARDKGRGELEGFWGIILEDTKETGTALYAHRLAIQHAPDAQPSYLRLAYLLRRENVPDPAVRKANQQEADRIVEDLVKKNPESHEAYLTRWRYRRDFNQLQVRPGDSGIVKLDVAAEDVAAAIKRKPESVDVLLAAADVERMRSRAAGEDGSRAVTERRQLMKEHRDVAATHLRRGLEIVARNPNATSENGRFQLLWHQANLLLDDLDVARLQALEDHQPEPDQPKVKKEVAAVIEQIGRSQVAAADYVRGRLLIHQREWRQAADLFEGARALLDDQTEMACQANLYLAQCYEQLEEYGAMYDAFNNVLKRDPTSMQAQLGMATARTRQQRDGEAMQMFLLLMKSGQVPARGWLDVARLEIRQQSRKETPDWSGVAQALRNAEKIHEKAAVEIALLRTEVWLRKRQPDKARQLLEAERLRNPKEADLHAALVDLALREKKMTLAASALKQGKRDAGDGTSLRLAEARFLASTLTKKEANEAIAKIGAGAGKLPEDEQARLLSGVAETLERNGDQAGARKTWQSLAALPSQKNNLRLRLLLFDLAMRAADEPGMKAALDDVGRVELKSGTHRRYGQAMLFIWKAKPDKDPADRDELLNKAVAELNQVRRQRGNWAPIDVALAEIAEAKGTLALALTHLENAQSNGDTSAATLRKQDALLRKLGRRAEADKILAKLDKATLRQADLWQLRAGGLMQAGREDEALAIVRDRVRDSSSPRHKVLLANTLLATWRKDRTNKKLLDEIAQLYDQAVEQASNDPLPYVAKVQFLAELDRKKDAKDVITELNKKIPADRASLAMGRCYDLIGDADRAKSFYDKALKENPDDAETHRTVAAAHLAAGRGPMAEDVLRKMASGKMPGLSSNDVAQSQRTLALLLAGGTDFRRFTEALSLVGVRLDDQGRLQTPAETSEPDEVVRARARVLATQNQRQFRTAAIKLFEKLRDKGNLPAEERFILARLYELDGEARKSQDSLAELINKNPTPQYLAQYTNLLITQKNELAEAEKKLVVLEDLERKRGVGPNSYGTVELRAKLLEQQGKKADALELMRKHVERKDARPEEVVLLITTMSRHKDFEGAFKLCEKTWDDGKCGPEVIGAVSVSLLSVWKDAKDAQIRVVERRVADAVKKNDKSVVLRLYLAQIHDKRGQYDLAADEYRKVLDVQPDNVVALNNLAWMLATRAGDAEKALQYVEKAIAGMGRRADLLDTRALVRLALKQPAKAVADLKDAIEDGETATRLYHLARAYHENQETEKATAAMRKARDRGLEVASLHFVEQEAAAKLLDRYR